VYVPPYEFRSGVGGVPGGYNVLEVQTDGRASYTFCDVGDDWSDPADGRGDWKRVEFQLTTHQRRALWDKLQEVDFFGLRDNYAHPFIVDGTSRFVAVKERSTRKTVWCSNLVPHAVRLIEAHVWRSILHPMQASRNTAVPSKPP
jgi:hypothetical protein